eukprot:scpid15455/ scgid27935/ Centrosomal protein of 89 kDa; Coiled-coil domain-containing protein 123
MPLKFFSSRKKKTTKDNDTVGELLPSIALAAVPHTPSPLKQSETTATVLSQAAQLALLTVNQEAAESTLPVTQHLQSGPPKITYGEDSRDTAAGSLDVPQGYSAIGAGRLSADSTNPIYTYTRSDGHGMVLEDDRLTVPGAVARRVPAVADVDAHGLRPRLASPQISSVSLVGSLEGRTDAEEPGYSRVSKTSTKQTSTSPASAAQYGQRETPPLIPARTLEDSELSFSSVTDFDDGDDDELDRGRSGSVEVSPLPASSDGHHHLQVWSDSKHPNRRRSRSLQHLAYVPMSAQPARLKSAVSEANLADMTPIHIGLGQSLTGVFSQNSRARRLQAKAKSPKPPLLGLSPPLPPTRVVYHELEDGAAGPYSRAAANSARRSRRISDTRVDGAAAAAQEPHRLSDANEYNTLIYRRDGSVDESGRKFGIQQTALYHPDAVPGKVATPAHSASLKKKTKKTAVSGQRTPVASSSPADKVQSSAERHATRVPLSDASHSGSKGHAPAGHGRSTHNGSDVSESSAANSTRDRNELVLLLAQQQKTAMDLAQQQQEQMQLQLQKIQEIQMEQLRQQQQQQQQAPAQDQLGTVIQSHLQDAGFPGTALPEQQLQQVHVPASVDEFVTALAQNMAERIQQQPPAAAPQAHAEASVNPESRAGEYESPLHQSASGAFMGTHSAVPAIESDESYGSLLKSTVHGLPSTILSESFLHEGSPENTINQQRSALHQANSLLKAFGKVNDRPATPDDVVLGQRLQALIMQMRDAEQEQIAHEKEHAKIVKALRKKNESLRENNQQLVTRLETHIQMAGTTSEKASNALRSKEKVHARELSAAKKAHREMQFENERLRRLLDSAQDLDSPSALAERQKAEHLRARIQDYELIMHHQNEQLAYLQAKCEDHRTHEEMSTSGMFTTGSRSRSAMNTEGLCPLLVAYDKRLEEKDKFIRRQEAELERVKRRVVKLIEENGKISLSMEHDRTYRGGLGQEERDALEQRCDTLEAQNRNLLERNQLLHKKSKVLSATAKEQVSSEHQDLVKLQKKYRKLQEAFTALGSTHSDMRTAHDTLLERQSQLTSKKEMSSAVDSWQERYRKLETKLEEIQQSNEAKIKALQDDKKDLISKVTDASLELQGLQKKAEDTAAENIELDGTVNHLRKQLDSSEDIASDLRKQLSSTTIEVERLIKRCDALKIKVKKERQVNHRIAEEAANNSQKMHATKQRFSSDKLKSSRKLEQMSVRLEEQESRHVREVQEIQKEVRHVRAMLDERHKEVHRLQEDSSLKDEQLQRLLQATSNHQQHLRSSAATLSRHTSVNS